LVTATGDINQAAPISAVTLSARADAGSVNLINAGNQVQQLAGFANGAGGFNFRNNSMSLTIGVAGPETGITSLGSGPVNINAGGNLMLLSPVSSQAGDIVLASAGTLDTNQATVSSTSGRVTVQGIVLQPSLADCIANPAPAGCAAVLPTLSACQSDPDIPGCSVVLPPPVASPPTLDTCIAAPSTSGCAAVLPTLAQWISASTTAGCSVVLPTLAQCTNAPMTAGCSVVLPTLAQCTATPASPGCTVIVPPVSQNIPDGPVAQALNSTINVINSSTSSIALSTKPITASTAPTSGGTKTADTQTADTKTTDKNADAKSDDADKQSVVKKDDVVKKMYCN
jgi:hypothetical protein